MIVKDYNSKKLVEYLKPGMSVCLVFEHGLGDTFMFYPYFLKLKQQFPSTHIVLYTKNGQEAFFGNVSKDEADYDIVFIIDFKDPKKPYTKAEYCCVQELGLDIERGSDIYCTVKRVNSPLVGVHFNSTCNPEMYGCPESTASLIWRSVEANGLVPIETHFIHSTHNSKNRKYSFVTNNVRSCTASIDTLVGLLQTCCGFIGVSSGPFSIASKLYPNKCLYLENKYPLYNICNSKDILIMDVNKFDSTVFKEWLTRVRS